jgi:hypothetical protein
MFFGVISYGPLTDYKWSQWRPQIRKKVDRISNFGPSNPQKRYIDLTNFGPQIRKIADTNHQELPGASTNRSVSPCVSQLLCVDVSTIYPCVILLLLGSVTHYVYCTNSLNSAVTGHRVPLPAEMSQVSQPVRLGDETIL